MAKRGNSDLVDISGELRHETDKAFLFWDGGNDEPVWLPKSQVEWDETGKIMTMPEWLALEKGLI